MARQLTDAQRARKNLKARIKYAENKKGITFENFDEINKYEWETEEEYIERINEYRGEELWQEGEEETVYIDELLIPAIEDVFSNFENLTASNFRNRYHYAVSKYKKGIAEAAFNLALSTEGYEDLSIRLSKVTNADEITSYLEKGIYDSDSWSSADSNLDLNNFLRLIQDKALSLEEAQNLANYYDY